MRIGERGALVMDDGTVYDYSGAGRTIGLDIRENQITFGYDSSLYNYSDDPEDCPHIGLYRQHRRELADFMIAQWQKWRDEK